MSYRIEPIHALSAPDFRRLLGVKRETFEALLAVLTGRAAAQKKRGRPPDLTLEQQLLLALQFWREYRTHYHWAAEWQVAENTVRRTIPRVENALVKSGAFARPGRRKVGGAEPPWQVLVMEVTESPVERPKKKQRACYSGQKKRHTLKRQIAVDKATGTSLALAGGPGREHDFRLFKRSKRPPHPDTERLAGSGYQGLAQRHANTRTPYKRRRQTIALPPAQQAYPRALARERVIAENVLRRLKVFRLLQEPDRHRRKRLGLRVHLLAGLYNHDLQVKS